MAEPATAWVAPPASGLEALWAVAAHGLGAPAPLPPAPTGAAWHAWLALVRDHRLSGLALRAEADGVLPLAPAQRAELGAVHRDAMLGVLEIERALLHAVAALRRAGIDHRVLKGAFAAHTLYDDPAERIYGDVDLLVPSGDLEAAVALLVGLGFRRRSPELRPGFDRRYGKAVTLEDAGGLQIDLHRTLLMGPHGLLLDSEDLFAAHREVLVGGTPVRGLDPVRQALHAAFTVALGDVPPRPVAARDLATLLLRPDLDRGALQAMAGRARATAVLARGTALAWDRLSPDAPEPLLVTWGRQRTPTPAELRLMRSYLDRRGGYALKALDAARVLPTARDRVRFLWAVGAPRRGFLDGQGVSQWQWVQRGARHLLRQGRT